MDSVSNISSKRSTKVSSSSHGSRSSRSSISSTRLKAEADLAALRVSQQMLQKKHVLEEQEEQLRRRKERVDSESHASVHRIVSKPLHSDAQPCVPSTSVQAATQSVPTFGVSHGDDTQRI